MDVFVWYTGKRCLAVSSFDDLSWFKPENAPEGAAERCVDCKTKVDCHTNFTVSAYSYDISGRYTKFMGTKGEMIIVEEMVNMPSQSDLLAGMILYMILVGFVTSSSVMPVGISY